MPWRTITSFNITGRMTAAEQAMLSAASGSTSKLQERLTDSIGKFIGAMSAAGYPVNRNGTVPDQLRNHITADAVWEWLKDFPALKMFKTDERKAAAETAEKVYEKIVTQTYGAIEAPSGPDLTGNWNSENKLIMRTHPTPSPYEQFQDTEFNQPTYANPNATSDSVQVLVPEAPKDLVAQSVSGHASLLWSPPLAAITFNVYRGTASGNETLFATGLTGAGYVDKAVVPGSTYFYTVTGVNSVGESAKSVETSVTI